MTAWHEFYDVVAGVAATLLGLLFVSVSLNAELILGADNKHSRRLAEQAFQNLLGALVIALVVLIPGIDAKALGITVLLSAGVWIAWVIVRAYQSLRALARGLSRLSVLRRFLAPVVAFAFLAYAGERMLNGRQETGSMAAGVIMLLVSATAVAWDLLIRIAEEKYTQVLKPDTAGPVGIWDGQPKRASLEHNTIYDEP